jgi:hypothetical protein
MAGAGTRLGDAFPGNKSQGEESPRLLGNPEMIVCPSLLRRRLKTEQKLLLIEASDVFTVCRMLFMLDVVLARFCFFQESATCSSCNVPARRRVAGLAPYLDDISQFPPPADPTDRQRGIPSSMCFIHYYLLPATRLRLFGQVFRIKPRSVELH